MGLFKFAKDAGEKMSGALTNSVFGGLLKKGASKPEEEVDASGVDVAHEGSKVILKGKAKTQADAEKMIVAAGNTAGVEEVESQIEVEDPAPEAQFYEVKSGDSLSKIAKEFYGDAMKYPVIFEANKPMLTDPDKIYPGQTLRIPPAA
ncbi:MAG: peptidoglycan-binding protein LysM [Pseudomonadota bacterium]